MRYRILRGTPRGGQALVALDAELRPLEQQLDVLREQLADYRQQVRAALSTYLSASEAEQDALDAVLEAELDAELQASLAAPSDSQATAAAGDQSDVAQSDKSAELAQRLADARAAAETARLAWQTAQQPVRDLETDMAPLLAQEYELLVAIEIEKRGLPLRRLELDREGQVLRLAEARTQLAEAEVALQSGAISGQRVQELAAAVEDAESQLTLIDRNFAIASQGVPAEELTAARLQAEASAVKARQAERVRDQKVAKLAAQIRVKETELSELDHQLSELRDNFPSILAMERDRLQQALLATTDGDAD